MSLSLVLTIPTLCLCTTLFASAETSVITSCRTLASSIYDRRPHQSRFDVTALTTTASPVSPHQTTLTMEDASGGVSLTLGTSWTGLRPMPGTTIRMRGIITVTGDAFVRCVPDSINILSTEQPPPPHEISLADFLSGRYNHRYIRMRGLVKSVARDEIDPKFIRLSIFSENEFISASLMDFGTLHDQLAELIDSTVSFAGICSPTTPWSSRLLGQSVGIVSTNDIQVLRRDASAPFAAPPIDTLYALHPSKIQSLGPHRICGRVMAFWDGKFALVKDTNGRMTRLDCIQEAPPVDATVEAVGYPLSDLFHINLAQVRWRPTALVKYPIDEHALPTTSSAICRDDAGRTCYKRDFHGRLVRMRGCVQKSLGPDGVADSITLDDGDCVFAVNAGPVRGLFRDLAVGSVVEVTGVCILQTDDWRPTAAFPRITGFSLVLRRPEDLTVLSRPPWWTARRIACAFALLLGILTLSAFANVFLRKIIRKRDRELKDEIMAHVESELKINERTRLAIELHDSISQNLTGVALELQTIDQSGTVLPAEIRHHLDVASRSLDSCRDELRYCLWDLRNNTLEQDNVANAIERTVRPHIGSAKLSIRFLVPRERLSDNTTHTILRTIRELATNAVRHGKASAIRIAGSIENNRLLFSVADNGCGFDTERCPGVEDGHYGLLGVRERLASADGTFTIISNSKGTKATASLPVPMIPAT